MGERTVELSGVRTRVRDEGSGPAVVLIHATPFDLDYWSGLATHLHVDHRVIRYDLPGHGTSTAAPMPSTDRLVGDLVDLLDAFDLSMAHVVGHSLGATVALRCALEYPGRVQRLSLLAARASPSSVFANLADALRCDAAVADVSINRWFSPYALKRDGAAVRYARARIEATPVAVWADGLDRLAETDVLDELPRLTMPVDVVVGEDDHGAKPEQSQKIAQMIPHAQFHLIPRAGSLVALENPQVVARFLRTGDGAPAEE